MCLEHRTIARRIVACAVLALVFHTIADRTRRDCWNGCSHWRTRKDCCKTVVGWQRHCSGPPHIDVLLVGFQQVVSCTTAAKSMRIDNSAGVLGGTAAAAVGPHCWSNLTGNLDYIAFADVLDWDNLSGCCPARNCFPNSLTGRCYSNRWQT